MRGAIFIASFFLIGASSAPVPDPAPWKQSDAIIIPDPYGANPFHFDQAFKDPKIKGIILKAASGLTIDNRVLERARTAKSQGIPFGIYLLGLSPSTERPRVNALSQADFLVDLGRRTGATMLALDVEDLKSSHISLADAVTFINRVYEKSTPHRYPVFYTNKGVTDSIAQHYDSTSVFAKTQLWVAGTKRFTGNRVWHDFALWQFGAEWDCPDWVLAKAKRERKSRFTLCLPYRQYPVAGSEYDLDINYLNGGQAAFDALFARSPQPAAGQEHN